MDSIVYKSLVIEAKPYQLRDSTEWAINIIVRDNNSEKQFAAANTYPTKEEAIIHCFNFGRKVIDGQIPGCSFP